MLSVNNSNQEDQTQNPFAFSIGDLMAALLLIFILLLSSTLLRLEEEFERKAHIPKEYSNTKTKIYVELMIEFKDDLKAWDADIDPNELIFRFKEPNVLFGNNQYMINSKFADILNNFFPRYISVLTRSEFIEDIEEIRIEGHTDNVGTYFHNMELSQNRTRSVLSHVLENTLGPEHDKDWVMRNLTANGLSFSKPIADNSTEDGRKLNRRVEFRIRTNAEKQIERLLNLYSNE
jgi:outer membrane protein OmpA-like peptidoglycan-associated protein